MNARTAVLCLMPTHNQDVEIEEDPHGSDSIASDTLSPDALTVKRQRVDGVASAIPLRG